MVDKPKKDDDDKEEVKIVGNPTGTTNIYMVSDSNLKLMKYMKK
jgi:hypothetical protein